MADQRTVHRDGSAAVSPSTISCRSNGRLTCGGMHRRPWLPMIASLAAGLLVAAPATWAQDAPGAGFADPEGVPRRPPVQDIEPVYRGPSVDTMATVRKRGRLRVGIASNAPMVMRDAQGRLQGYSIDLATRLAEDLGVEVEFVETPWSQVVPDLLARQFDLVVSGMWISPARALVVNFSEPTASEGIYLVASRQLASRLKTRADFNRPDVTIVVYGGSLQAEVARREFPQARLQVVTGDQDHLAPVLAGQAHAALVPTFSPQAIERGAPDRLVLPLAAPVAVSSTAIAMRKGDPDMLNFVNTWLRFRGDEGWLGERAQRWQGSTDWLR